jgi:hypothetical protein
MTGVDAAWQAALAAEHQAAFGYALLGPKLRGTQQQEAVACSDAHEALRNATEAWMNQAGLRPVPPLPDYPALYPVPNAATARQLAVRLEDDCAAAWRYLYAQAARARAHSRMAEAQAALTASALRATTWRLWVDPNAATTPFPGG